MEISFVISCLQHLIVCLNKQFSFKSYLLNFSSNFIKPVIFKRQMPCLSGCERVFPEHKILSPLKQSKVRSRFLCTCPLFKK